MKKKARHANAPSRRTTVALPADALAQAARIAKSRNLRIGTVIAQAFADGVSMQAASGRGDRVMQAYKTAFGGFADDELAVLDGVTWE